MSPEERYWDAKARGIVPWPGDRPGGPAHGLSDEELTRACVESRASQGLPPTVQDPTTVERIAAMLSSNWGEMQ